MNRKSQRCYEAIDRTIQYGTMYPPTPAVARATTLFTGLATTKTKLQELGADQIIGQTSFRGAVDSRMSLRDQLVESLQEINKIARALDTTEFPNAREQFRMPLSRSYVNLVATARSFAEHAGGMTAAFTERGRPATFVADLEALATSVANAAGPREQNRGDMVGATMGIEEYVREGVAALRELDSILTPLVKTDPVQLGRWKTAVTIERVPVGSTAATPEEPPPSGGGSGGTPVEGSGS